MGFEWTPHRFVSGALALDVANSVILRFDARKKVDRFADMTEISRFCDAARRYCGERSEFGDMQPVPDARIGDFINLRESIDRLFRASLSAPPPALALADLLDHVASSLRAGAGDPYLALDTATAHSALRLVGSAERDRMKICSHCQWLFLDRSKNQSRTWCDMAVCGNRVKARLHYARRKQGERS